MEWHFEVVRGLLVLNIKDLLSVSIAVKDAMGIIGLLALLTGGSIYSLFGRWGNRVEKK